MIIKKKFFFVIIAILLTNLSISAFGMEEAMHGVWVSTVYNLDFPSYPTCDSTVLKSEIDSIVLQCKKTGYNAVFLQVRPCADSFYPSKVFPWSKYLSGQSGLAPSDEFDPLKYWIQKCHEYGIELHAWINPYRITKDKDSDFEALSENHPAKLNPGWVVKYTDGNYYFNPGIPEVRDLVLNGVKEILQNYDVDGIHMDDYFYPGPDFQDALTFETHNNGQFTDISDWRRNNVNLLVESLHLLCKEYNKTFGISPSGIWDNLKDNPLGSNTRGKSSYSQLFADSRAWVKMGFLDYIAPQIYWEFGYTAADFETLSNWWADVCDDTGVKLYIGLATYRAAEATEASPWYNGKETLKQLSHIENDPRISGEIHFRYKLIDGDKNLKRVISDYYKRNEVFIIKNGMLNFKKKDSNSLWGNMLVPLNAIFDASKTSYYTIDRPCNLQK